MKKSKYVLSLMIIAAVVTIIGCSREQKNEDSSVDEKEVVQNVSPSPTDLEKEIEEGNGEVTESIEETENIKEEEFTIMMKQSSKELQQKVESYFTELKHARTIKGNRNHNPLMTQRFGADPYVIVYDERVYVYMTGDTLEYDAAGKVKENSFSKINTLNVLSSADLVNWTDHGSIYVAGAKGVAKWGGNSWAPAVAYKEIDGVTKFFIYFANGGNGIGVLTSDSPTGPFIDPLGHALISRSTPNCANVTWLFDPAAFVDDDGRAYLYFGGGVPNEQFANPGTGRVVELGADMISLAHDPISLDIPYLFEDSGMHKIDGTYYYSYCSNWNVSKEDAATLGFDNAQIVYMTSDNPMGPFTLQGPAFKNPGHFFGVWGTNHHCFFNFKDQWYLAYHTQMLEGKLFIKGGYRSTNIDAVTINEDGSIAPITGTMTGVEQVAWLSPYAKNEAETISDMAGINTTQYGIQSETYGSGNMVVNEIHSGDWIKVRGVDFGEKGANSFTASVLAQEGQYGVIQLRKDELDGEIIGYLEVGPTKEVSYVELSTELLSTVTGVHDVVFVFYGEGYTWDYWYFNE